MSNRYLYQFSEMLRSGNSERARASALGISRAQLRQLKAGMGNPTLKTLHRLAELSNYELEILLTNSETLNSENSVAVVSSLITQDGFDSWPLHIMNFVDAFRRRPDRRLIILPPVPSLDPKLLALLASTVEELCRQIGSPVPHWVTRTQPLARPFFVSGIENLKASALVESPFSFRKRNIFVLGNFLERT